MKRELVIKALNDEGFKTRLDYPEFYLVASEGVHNVSFSRETIDDAPIQWIVEKAKREIARLKEVAN